MTDKTSDPARMQGGRHILLPLLAIGVLLAVLIGAVLHQLGQSASLPATAVAAAGSPLATPTGEALTVVATATGSTPRLTPTSTLLPTPTAGLLSPPETPIPAPTPGPPDWDQVYALLGASDTGTDLLILHTNDTWGYLDPCG